MLTDATNCALNHDVITVTTSRTSPIVIDMNVVSMMTIDAMYDNVNDITVTATVTMTIAKII